MILMPDRHPCTTLNLLWIFHSAQELRSQYLWPSKQSLYISTQDKREREKGSLSAFEQGLVVIWTGCQEAHRLVINVVIQILAIAINDRISCCDKYAVCHEGAAPNILGTVLNFHLAASLLS